jgi:hypothetical protein
MLTKRNLSVFSITWCSIKFNETFLDPINKFCKTPSTIISLNRTLFTGESRKFKRDLHFSQLNPNLHELVSVPTIENEWKKLDMASLAASLMMIKSSINKIGAKWLRGEVDEQFITSPYLSIQLPNNNSITQYEPFSCALDQTCKQLRLELKLKQGFNTVSSITGWNNTEDILCITLLTLLALLVMLIGKLRSALGQRNRAYTQILTNSNSNRKCEEALLVPPPYPQPENV